MTLGTLLVALTIANVLGAALFHFLDGALKGWLAARHPEILMRWMGPHPLGGRVGGGDGDETDAEIDARLKAENEAERAMWERLAREQRRREHLAALGILKPVPPAHLARVRPWPVACDREGASS